MENSSVNFQKSSTDNKNSSPQYGIQPADIDDT